MPEPHEPNAPERTLWLCPLGNAWWECEPGHPGGAAYVSLAHAEAMVSAERERCANLTKGDPFIAALIRNPPA